MTKTLPSTILAGLLAMLLTACGQGDMLRVDQGWVRLSAVEGNPAAAYFTLHGGETDTQLLSITTNVAIRTEIHETMREGGMMKMTPLTSLDVPAGAEIKFEPGGKHVMLFNLNPGIKPGQSIPLIFTFANGLRIQYDPIVHAAGDGAPAADK